ncbi:MAG: entericidin A/B family lipoprotein [Pseudomonadota bacterium]
MKAKLLLVLAVLAGAVSVTACNTVEGLGQDIEKGGEALQREAEQNK